MKASFETEFDFFRCPNCGTRYAVEQFNTYKTRHCPLCTIGKVYERNEEIERLTRVVRGYKSQQKKK